MDRSRFPLDPWRLVESDHDPESLGVDRDAVHGGQRLPGPEGEPRGGAGRVRARHLRQRVPRDLGDPARGGGLRLRAHRSDHRERPGRQAGQGLRRRRAAHPRHRRHRALRAVAGLPRRRTSPQPGVAHPLGQAGPDRLDPDGLDDPAASRGDHARGHHAERGRPDRDLVAAAQPSGRHRRVPRRHPDARGADGPPQVRRVRRAGAGAAASTSLVRTGCCWATGAPTRG